MSNKLLLLLFPGFFSLVVEEVGSILSLNLAKIANPLLGAAEDADCDECSAAFAVADDEFG